MMTSKPAGRVPVPLVEFLGQLKTPVESHNPRETLRQVVVESQVLQDFRPLAHSLEWELSDLHWASAGVLPFAENAVPFLINNTGRLSENAAALVYANCREFDDPGRPIRLLELGAGTGLFARYFLDAFEAICRQEGRDFHERLTYFVTDRSPGAIEHWRERDLFAAHAGRVVATACDAANPGAIGAQGLRAVFCNYVLDVLPATVIRKTAESWEELQVRTHLIEDRALVAQYTTLTIEQIRALASSEDPAERARLIPLLPLFDFEVAFRPNGAAPAPGLEAVLEFGKDLDRILWNYGAIHSIERSIELLDSRGLLLINDYGPVQPDQVAGHGVSQRFGNTTALGLDFPLLESHFGARSLPLVKPEGDDDRSIHARLIVKSPMPRTLEAFENRFSAAAYQYFESPIEEAHKHSAAGRHSEALDSYRAALARGPRDWQLIGEVAEFVGLQLRDYAAGLELCRSALELDPCYSAWLWNVFGDCLFCLERFDVAHQAYLQAHRIDPNDPRANLNLAYTYCQSGDFQEATAAIARGLAGDPRALYRDKLLEKQQQILAALSARWVSEQERLARRAARFQ